MIYIILSNKHSNHYTLDLTSSVLDNNFIGLLTYFELNDIHGNHPITENIYSEHVDGVLDQVIPKFRDRGDVITVFAQGNDDDLINYRSVEIGFSFKEKLEGATEKRYLNGSILYYYKCEVHPSLNNEFDDLVLDSLKEKTSFQHDFEFVMLKMKNYSSLKEMRDFKRPSDSTTQELIFNAYHTDQTNKELIQLKFELNIVSYLNEDAKKYIPNPIPLSNLNDKQKQLIKGILAF